MSDTTNRQIPNLGPLLGLLPQSVLEAPGVTRAFSVLWSWADRIFAGALLAFYIYRSSGSMSGMATTCGFALLIFIMVWRAPRREAKSLDARSLLGLILSYGAPALFTPNAAASLPVALVDGVIDTGHITTAFYCFYIGLLAWGYFSLRNSFAILPANRPKVFDGTYAFIRHPIYSCYIHIALGTLLTSPSVINGVSTGLFVFGLYLRARSEEAMLGQSPDYEAFTHRVRHRFFHVMFSFPLVTFAMAKLFEYVHAVST